LATGVAYRLSKAGHPVIVLELAHPLVVRRRVSLASAVLEGEVIIEGLCGRRVDNQSQALDLALTGVIPVLVSPRLPSLASLSQGDASPSLIPILVDARIAKRNIDTNLDQAQLVIALGPGFVAGQDCHAVVETKRGHRLGRVIWMGGAQPNTGTPGTVAGKGAERVLRAPSAGTVRWRREIGHLVVRDERIGEVAGHPVIAPFDGVLRGLIAPGTEVKSGLKIGDLDARSDVSTCFTISDKALSIGAGALEAIQLAIFDFGFSIDPFSRRKAHHSLTPLSSRRSPAHYLAYEALTRSHSHTPTLSLPSALQITAPGELVALVGGGGKSSLMFSLARVMPGRTVITTTTRIFSGQMSWAPAVCLYDGREDDLDSKRLAESENGLSDLAHELDRYGHCLVIGQVSGEKATGVPVELPGKLLSRADVDYVIVEADGSRRRPSKAPAEHEPVLPSETTLVVPVVGIDALDGPLNQKAHRPERVAALTGMKTDQPLTPESLAILLTHPEGGLKGVPAAARLIPFINKVDDERHLVLARLVARQALRHERVDRVVIGALRGSRQVREIHRRVTAVVLAAGDSRRMGRAKQLLPWGQTTVLGQTLANLRASVVHDIMVVSGFEAEAVEAIAVDLGASTVRNPEYAHGEMLSSLQAAVRTLPENRAAVLVMLADQPMVEVQSINRLLVAYWQGRGELIAPAYKGQRGNPVLIGRPFFNRLLALPEGSAPRELLQRHHGDLYLVEMDSDQILRDLDRPDDYRRRRPAGTPELD